MRTLLMIVGPTGSGKSTLFKYFKDLFDTRNDCYTIIPYTTRPRRENEANGDEYFFINEESFSYLNNNSLLIGNSSYETFLDEKLYPDGGCSSLLDKKKVTYSYAYSKSDFVAPVSKYTDMKNYSSIMIGNYKLAKDQDFKERYIDPNFDKCIVLQLIPLSLNILYERLIRRGDNLDEIMRRLEDDKEILHVGWNPDEIFDFYEGWIGIYVDLQTKPTHFSYRKLFELIDKIQQGNVKRATFDTTDL